MPAGGVAHHANTPGILGRRALPAGRLTRLGATPDFHHGLLDPRRKDLWQNASVKTFTLVVLAAAAGAAIRQGTPRWEPQVSGVTARLRGVSAVSERIAWASGAAGTVLRTADGGATWQAVPIAEAGKLDFRDVDAIDEKTAYVLSIGSGIASRIYKTIDAGAHWRLQFTNQDPKGFYDAMAFWDSTHGVAIGDSIDGHFVILTTTNGEAWARVPAEALPPALPNEGAFAGSGTNIGVLPGGRAWIGTGAAARCRVLRTKDGGTTWTIAETPIAAGPSTGIFSIAFRDPVHGMVVGGDYRKEDQAVENAAMTVDGGVSWKSLRGLGGFRSAVAVVPGARQSWLAVGPRGADLSKDDGATWSAIEGAGYHAFSFARRGKAGWGVGEAGRIGKLIW
jgi:photosystem II stability/assembly factor-like uncharacterized protein